MATKPTDIPTFATDASAVKVDIPSDIRTKGWQAGEALSEGHHNSWWHLQGSWINYVADSIFTDDSAIEISYNDGSENGAVRVDTGGVVSSWNGTSGGFLEMSDSTFASLRASRGFRASNPVGGSDRAGMPYAYHQSLSVEHNLCPLQGGWTGITDTSSTAPNAVSAPDSEVYNNDGYLNMGRTSGSNDIAMRRPLLLPANPSATSSVYTLTGMEMDAEVSAGTLTLEIVRIEKADTPTAAAAQAVVASISTTSTTAVRVSNTSLSVALAPTNYQYFIQARLSAPSGSANGLYRDVTLTYSKIAVE